MIKSLYDSQVESGLIEIDNEQQKVLAVLQDFMEEILKFHESKNNKIRAIFAKYKPKKYGVYIYGDVGRGKSMLMDLFSEHFVKNHKDIKVLSAHFDEFMQSVHKKLNQNKNSKGDRIRKVAKKISKDVDLLCFDEFQILDIADAMIIGRFFKNLFDNDSLAIITSNRHPDDLYKDGLQRERFLPFIDILKERMMVISLDGEKDYRANTKNKEAALKYFIGCKKNGEVFIKNKFDAFLSGQKTKEALLEVHGRKLKFKNTHKDAILCNFSELCKKALGAADYIEICKNFKQIFLYHIPQFNAENQDEARRFISLIDQIYEFNVNLVCSAAAKPEELYEDGKRRFEFRRTASRLMELCVN